MVAPTLREQLNSANPNQLADYLRSTKLGDWLRSLITRLYNKTPAAAADHAGTVFTIPLDPMAKAAVIHRAYARAGAGAAGDLAVAAYPPAAGQISVAPSGDLAFLAADAYTGVDVVYEPEKVEYYDVELPVVADVLTIPSQFTARGVVLLMSASATVGGATGVKAVLAPGAAAPAAGQCRLNLAKSTVTFAAADAVTKAMVRLGVAPSVDVDALLNAAAPYLAR